MDKVMPKTYATPELKKIGTVKDITQGTIVTDGDQISGSPGP